MQQFSVIGLDVGGTKITASLITPKGQMVCSLRLQMKLEEMVKARWGKILEMLQSLLDEAEKQNLKVACIGVGFDGPVDFERGMTYLSHHVPGWENFQLKENLEQKFKVKTFIDNDANVGALGEWKFGSGKGINDLLYLNIGTGIGAGIIIGGKLLRGCNNLAGEIGHLTVKPNGAICPCGRNGCLEAIASGTAISREGTKRLGQPVSSEEVFMLAENGNPIALKIIDEAVEALAFSVGATANLLNPKLIVLGGGVAEASESLLLCPLKEKLSRYTLPQIADKLEIVKANLGCDAGVIGAGVLALSQVVEDFYG